MFLYQEIFELKISTFKNQKYLYLIYFCKFKLQDLISRSFFAVFYMETLEKERLWTYSELLEAMPAETLC